MLIKQSNGERLEVSAKLIYRDFQSKIILKAYFNISLSYLELNENSLGKFLRRVMFEDVAYLSHRLDFKLHLHFKNNQTTNNHNYLAIDVDDDSHSY